MAAPRSKIYKPSLFLLIVALLFGAAHTQTSLNHQREALGLTRTAALENAPPMLMFTTVALGGFRGLIANALWIRANDMQESGRYFEMVQLADWITKLQPTITTVWVHQAWNMAYNITVKFPDHEDRWIWVKRAIELLRDQAIKYNPHEPLLYRELGWIFQHKMGHYMDDATETYKKEWGLEMNKLFGNKKANFDELINPQTPDQKERARLLREKYKMDPVVMKEVDQKYGPLEWRLPEAHAVYWGYYGLEKCSDQPLKKDDFITLRRLIFQGLQTAFHRGRMIYPSPQSQMFMYGPNLEIVKHVSDAYLEQAKLEPDKNEHILTGHRNFLTTAVYFLYSYGRENAAREWYAYLKETYPNAPGTQGKSMEEYAWDRVQEEVGSTDPNRIRAVIEGYIEQYLTDFAIGEDDHGVVMRRLAKKIHARYQEAVGPMSRVRVGLPPYDEIEQMVLKRMLNPEYEFPALLRAQLLTKLGLPQDYGKDIFTNAPIAIGLTNSLSITNGASTNAVRK
ncbi:MAG TPA: hypothetical protein VI282_09120 [Verrucomicrobiae bacterium]